MQLLFLDSINKIKVFFSDRVGSKEVTMTGAIMNQVNGVYSIFFLPTTRSHESVNEIRNEKL